MTSMATDPKRRALGKGLDSLLPRVHASVPAPAAVPSPESEGGHPRELPVELIDPNPYQTRSAMNEEQLAEMAASITSNGVIQPIVVRPQANGRFQLIAGERRWRGSQLAGKKTVPAYLRQVSDEQAMEITIIENLQRADLNPIEQARAFDRLGKEFHMTQDNISLRTGKDRTTIGNFLRLLKLPMDVQNKVESGELSFGHAKALMGLQHHPGMEQAVKRVCTLSLSVRQTESMVQGILFPEGKKGRAKPEAPVDPNVKEVEERLQRALGLKVRVDDHHGRGKVVIEYATLADFDGLMERLSPQ